MRTTSRPAGLGLPATETPVIGPIIVALGGSDTSGVLRAAQLFQSTALGGMAAVSVLEPMTTYLSGEYPSLMSPEYEEERAAGRHASLRREISEAPNSADWETKVVYGDPSYALTTLARARHSPLIVMGIGRRRPIDRLLGVETAARTIRRAPCAVLAVSHTVSVPFRVAVVAMDFSVASISAAKAIVPLLASTAELHLVHVWEPVTDDDRLRPANAAYAASLPGRFERVTRLLAVPTGVTVKHEVREGSVAEHILTFADARHANVIVAGRHGLSVIERLFVGSVTTTLLHGTTCSLLVAPEPSLAERSSILQALSTTTERSDPSTWASLLEGFSERNHGRRTVVEVDDVTQGAQIVASGYAFQGAAYDRHDRAVTLMLGDSVTAHMTRTITDVASVALHVDAGGHDAALRIAHAHGQTLLTFDPSSGT